ncbi:MAG TPA: thiamine pyrophosphate-dependent dehydrogenase E1 component subunit alpha [Nitrospiraceae bacterium]|nr:thiamine pyrophosphate-dependent dehydrogenase E1 component subunit alpha [Nitrospiraceae bacterium]
MYDDRTWAMELLTGLYRTMLLIRLTEERIAALIEAKEIKTPCHLCIGQEAIAAGVCAALDGQDSIWGGHRSHGHYLAKGGDLNGLLAEILGKTTGCSTGRGGSMHLIDTAVGVMGTVPLVGATIPLAAGAAWASKLRGDGRVAVAFFGDGATEEGHFHESLNLASLYRLPVLFVCENNFYSTHMPLAERRPKDNIVQSADLHGMPGVRVDGNDVMEVYESARAAVKRARDGQGPTLLECRTYRWRGHVGPAWDLDVGEQRRRELEEWLPKDPLPRLRRRIVEAGGRLDEFDTMEQEVRADIEAAVRFARDSPTPDPSELLQHVYGPRG